MKCDKPLKFALRKKVYTSHTERNERFSFLKGKNKLNCNVWCDKAYLNIAITYLFPFLIFNTYISDNKRSSRGTVALRVSMMVFIQPSGSVGRTPDR